jgi:uncharacterized protein (DUF2141 family)
MFTMTRKNLLFATVLCLFAFVAAAANVDGKWTAQVPGREGQTRETTFTLKADGEKLTGSMSGRQGNETPITEGKISGDTISFVVTMDRGGNTIKWNYTGTVTGDEIKMKRAGGQGEPREFVAKRAQ